MIGDLSTDPLNTVTTLLPEGQIQIYSLNVNGLIDIKLSLLLSYMSAKKLEVWAIQDTRLTVPESNRMGSVIRNKYQTNVQEHYAPIAVRQGNPRRKRGGGKLSLTVTSLRTSNQ